MTEFSSVTVDDSGNVHGQVTLAIGNAGLPVIAYTTQTGEVRLAEQTPEGEWIITTPPCGTAVRDEYRISLDLDSNSEPHIALANRSTPTEDHLIYGARGQQQWEFEHVPTEGGVFPGSVRFPSMKLYKGAREVPVPDEQGNLIIPFKDSPHISYQGAQGLIELRHAAKLRPRDNRDAAPVWRRHVHKIDGSESGWFSVLNISNDDLVRIAHFRELSGGTKVLHVMSMDNDQDIPDRPIAEGEEGFRKQTLDGGSREIRGESPSLALQLEGVGAVSYTDRSTIRLCIFAGGQSVVEDVATVESGGSRSSVGRDFMGRWCVVYGSDGRLQFASRRAGAFTIEDVEVGGGWPSMVFNDDGNAQIAHVAGGTLRFVVAVPDE